MTTVVPPVRWTVDGDLAVVGFDRDTTNLAAQKKVSASQLAIAWVLAKGTTIVPLIGARTRTQLAESLGALRVPLTPSEIIEIEDAIPATAVAGTRYGEQQMQILDSER
jgi:aryl-alcohol dehydrogenase-like predicted oxidoreductase